jgi:hypothetical protein
VPNKSYRKGYTLELDIVHLWIDKGYHAKRNWGSKPFDGIIMGHGVNIWWEAKNWKHYPKTFEQNMRKQYSKWIKLATKRGCKFVVFYKDGRGMKAVKRIDMN